MPIPYCGVINAANESEKYIEAGNPAIKIFP